MGLSFRTAGWRPGFKTTHWTEVIEPSRRGNRQALTAFYEAYRQPVYCFIRARGFPPDRAADLTHDVFATLLTSKGLPTVDRGRRRRFRSWLRRVTHHYLCNVRDHDAAVVHGGGKVHVSIGPDLPEEEMWLASLDGLTPERMFDRCWALAANRRTLARMREEYEKAGKARRFALIEMLLCADASDAELAEALQMSLVHVRVKRHQLREEAQAKYKRYLRDEIAGTVEDPHAVEDELHFLRDALG
jgi:DNA-directed RNA polymerase specialized sigma24 family protein